MIWKPLPCYILLHQKEERLNYVGEVGNKVPIEVTEAHEEAYCTDRYRRVPVVDGFEFDGIH